MTASSSVSLITDAITDFGGSALVVLGAIIVLGVGFLVFYWGWRKVRGAAK